MDIFTPKPVIQNVNGRALRKTYQEILPQADRRLNNFNSKIEFLWSNNGKYYFSPQESYLYVKCKLNKLTNGASPALLVDGDGIKPSFNMISTLFTSCTWDINSKNVMRVSNLPQVDTLTKRMSLSSEYRNTVGTSSLLIDDAQTRLDKSNFKVSGSQEFVWTPSFSFFNGSDLLPPALQHNFTLNIDSNYKRNVVVSSNAVVPETDYSFTVEDIKFYACLIEGDIDTLNGEVNIDITDGECVATPLTSQNSQNYYTVKPSCFKLASCVQSSLVGSDTRYSPTQFTDSVNNQDRNITLLRVHYANQTFPNPDYSISYSTGVNGSNTWKRVYFDYLQASGVSFVDSPTESFDSYTGLGRIIAHRVVKPSDDRSVQVLSACNLSSAPSSLNLWLYSAYSQVLKFVYQSGMCVDVQLIDL